MDMSGWHRDTSILALQISVDHLLSFDRPRSARGSAHEESPCREYDKDVVAKPSARTQPVDTSVTLSRHQLR
jgi:hypothetical protein